MQMANWHSLDKYRRAQNLLDLKSESSLDNISEAYLQVASKYGLLLNKSNFKDSQVQKKFNEITDAYRILINGSLRWKKFSKHSICYQFDELPDDDKELFFLILRDFIFKTKFSEKDAKVTGRSLIKNDLTMHWEDLESTYCLLKKDYERITTKGVLLDPLKAIQEHSDFNEWKQADEWNKFRRMFTSQSKNPSIRSQKKHKFSPVKELDAIRAEFNRRQATKANQKNVVSPQTIVDYDDDFPLEDSSYKELAIVQTREEEEEENKELKETTGKVAAVNLNDDSKSFSNDEVNQSKLVNDILKKQQKLEYKRNLYEQQEIRKWKAIQRQQNQVKQTDLKNSCREKAKKKSVCSSTNAWSSGPPLLKSSTKGDLFPSTDKEEEDMLQAALSRSLNEYLEEQNSIIKLYENKKTVKKESEIIHITEPIENCDQKRVESKSEADNLLKVGKNMTGFNLAKKAFNNPKLSIDNNDVSSTCSGDQHHSENSENKSLNSEAKKEEDLSSMYKSYQISPVCLNSEPTFCSVYDLPKNKPLSTRENSLANSSASESQKNLAQSRCVTSRNKMSLKNIYFSKQKNISTDLKKNRNRSHVNREKEEEKQKLTVFHESNKVPFPERFPNEKKSLDSSKIEDDDSCIELTKEKGRKKLIEIKSNAHVSSIDESDLIPSNMIKTEIKGEKHVSPPPEFSHRDAATLPLEKNIEPHVGKGLSDIDETNSNKEKEEENIWQEPFRAPLSSVDDSLGQKKMEEIFHHSIPQGCTSVPSMFPWKMQASPTLNTPNLKQEMLPSLNSMYNLYLINQMICMNLVKTGVISPSLLPFLMWPPTSSSAFINTTLQHADTSNPSRLNAECFVGMQRPDNVMPFQYRPFPIPLTPSFNSNITRISSVTKNEEKMKNCDLFNMDEENFLKKIRSLNGDSYEVAGNHSLDSDISSKTLSDISGQKSTYHSSRPAIEPKSNEVQEHFNEPFENKQDKSSPFKSFRPLLRGCLTNRGRGRGCQNNRNVLSSTNENPPIVKTKTSRELSSESILQQYHSLQSNYYDAEDKYAERNTIPLLSVRNSINIEKKPTINSG